MWNGSRQRCGSVTENEEEIRYPLFRIYKQVKN